LAQGVSETPPRVICFQTPPARALPVVIQILSMMSAYFFRATFTLALYMFPCSVAVQKLVASTIEPAALGFVEQSKEPSSKIAPKDGPKPAAKSTAKKSVQSHTQAMRAIKEKLHTYSVEFNKTQRMKDISVQQLHAAKARALSWRQALMAETKKVGGRHSKSERLSILQGRYHEAANEVKGAERALAQSKKRLNASRGKYMHFMNLARGHLPVKHQGARETQREATSKAQASAKVAEVPPVQVKMQVLERTEMAHVHPQQLLSGTKASEVGSSSSNMRDAVQPRATIIIAGNEKLVQRGTSRADSLGRLQPVQEKEVSGTSSHNGNAGKALHSPKLAPRDVLTHHDADVYGREGKLWEALLGKSQLAGTSQTGSLSDISSNPIDSEMNTSSFDAAVDALEDELNHVEADAKAEAKEQESDQHAKDDAVQAHDLGDSSTGLQEDEENETAADANEDDSAKADEDNVLEGDATADATREISATMSTDGGEEEGKDDVATEVRTAEAAVIIAKKHLTAARGKYMRYMKIAREPEATLDVKTAERALIMAKKHLTAAKGKYMRYVKSSKSKSPKKQPTKSKAQVRTALQAAKHASAAANSTRDTESPTQEPKATIIVTSDKFVQRSTMMASSSSSPSATLTTDTANASPSKENVSDISPDVNLSAPVGQASPGVESHSNASAPKYRDGDVLTNHDPQEMVDAEGKLLEALAASQEAGDTQTTTTMSENDQADEADAIEAKEEEEDKTKLEDGPPEKQSQPQDDAERTMDLHTEHASKEQADIKDHASAQVNGTESDATLAVEGLADATNATKATARVIARAIADQLFGPADDEEVAKLDAVTDAADLHAATKQERQKESRAEPEVNTDDEFAEKTEHEQGNVVTSHDSPAVDLDMKELEEERQKEPRAEAEVTMEDDAEKTEHEQGKAVTSHDSLAVDLDVKELEEEREARTQELEEMEAMASADDHSIRTKFGGYSSSVDDMEIQEMEKLRYLREQLEQRIREHLEQLEAEEELVRDESRSVAQTIVEHTTPAPEALTEDSSATGVSWDTEDLTTTELDLQMDLDDSGYELLGQTIAQNVPPLAPRISDGVDVLERRAEEAAAKEGAIEAGQEGVNNVTMVDAVGNMTDVEATEDEEAREVADMPDEIIAEDSADDDDEGFDLFGQPIVPEVPPSSGHASRAANSVAAQAAEAAAREGAKEAQQDIDYEKEVGEEEAVDNEAVDNHTTLGLDDGEVEEIASEDGVNNVTVVDVVDNSTLAEAEAEDEAAREVDDAEGDAYSDILSETAFKELLAKAERGDDVRLEDQATSTLPDSEAFEGFDMFSSAKNSEEGATLVTDSDYAEALSSQDLIEASTRKSVAAAEAAAIRAEAALREGDAELNIGEAVSEFADGPSLMDILPASQRLGSLGKITDTYSGAVALQAEDVLPEREDGGHALDSESEGQSFMDFWRPAKKLGDAAKRAAARWLVGLDSAVSNDRHDTIDHILGDANVIH